MPVAGSSAFLVLEPSAVSGALATAKLCNGHVWLGANSLTESEFHQLLAEGHLVTRFEHAVEPEDKELVQEALETMREHHPNVIVWVQFAGAQPTVQGPTSPPSAGTRP